MNGSHVGLPRRLAAFPAPLTGEPLPSWISHVATELNTDFLSALRGMGISPARNTVEWQQPDITPTDQDTERIRAATGLPLPLLRSLTLAPYLSAFPATRNRARHLTVRPSGTRRTLVIRVCPQCLTERGGRTKLTWLLPWKAACVQHRRYLLGQCPICGAAFDARESMHRRDWTCPAAPGIDPHPLAAPTVRDAALLDIQASLDAQFDAISTRRAADPGPFRDLEALLLLALAYGRTEALARADAEVRQTFAHYAQTVRGEPGRFARGYFPPDTALMAAAVRIAATVMQSPNWLEEAAQTMTLQHDTVSVQTRPHGPTNWQQHALAQSTPRLDPLLRAVSIPRSLLMGGRRDL